MEKSIATLEDILKATKKKEPVKTVTSKTCSNKLRIRILQMGIPLLIPEEFEQCIGCDNYEGNHECERFHPYQFTFPIRTGIYAHTELLNKEHMTLTGSKARSGYTDK